MSGCRFDMVNGKGGGPPGGGIPPAQRMPVKCPCGCPVLIVTPYTELFIDRLAPGKGFEQKPPANGLKCFDCGLMCILTPQGFSFMKASEVPIE